MLLTHIVCNNLLAKYAKNVLNNNNNELIINILFTFLKCITTKNKIDNKLVTKMNPKIMDSA